MSDPRESDPDALFADVAATEPDDTEPDTELDASDDQQLAEASFEHLLHFLKESRAFDFTGYKRPSLMRRVRHRMQEMGVDSFDDYQDVLQVRPDEFTALFNTILINVTAFFRDTDAWAHLAAEVLPEVLATADGRPIRVWSAGCSTGPEPYSIAMLLHDLMGPSFREEVKIYATDIDEDALAYARQATYTEREIQGVPERLRNRYFDTSGGRWVMTPDLRRSVIFGRNDLTKDAPISRIDLLLCRNTLMYFNAETQTRVVSRLGFALRPNGVLFLGKAEMLLNHASVFTPTDLKRRFFRKAMDDTNSVGALAPTWQSVDTPAPLDVDLRLRDEVLRSAPIAQIAIDAQGRLAMVNHRASAMLGLSDRDIGRPFQDLEISYRPVELRSHLANVAETRLPVWVREVDWRRSGLDRIYMDIQVVPLLDSRGHILGTSLSFTDVTRFRQLQLEVEAANRQLETAYEELQSTNEELETTNEELQSTVEELETTNEELQSTNEELETMNEELQSSNDEMQATNEELRDRTMEIGELNSFMRSVLNSLDAAVVVVNRDLVVRSWTTRAYDLWGLREDETVGQYLLNLDSGLPTSDLLPLLRSVVTGQQAHASVAVEAVNRRGRTVALRVSISQLRREDDVVDGALVLIDDGRGAT